ncbi:MAG: radical SAM protein [bacterium]|nr:radical SAM protein [bacterium]
MWKYIYGPVSSFRLGSSLGIDLLSQAQKICTFDCIYCQLGKTLTYTRKRRLYIPTSKIIEELEMLPKIQIDHITLSGMGEPILAENLGEVIKAIKMVRKEPVAVLTNSSLMDKEDVREELSAADFVVAKLDTYSQRSLELINRPILGIKFREIFNGLKQFRKEYGGKLALQIMFIAQNRECISKLADLSREIEPNEVQIDTPLRPCGVKPLSREEIFRIKEYFKGMKIVSVYDAEGKEVSPISQEDTLKRRGKVI